MERIMSFTPKHITRIDIGRRMSAAVVHNNTVYLAGQVADKTAGGSVKDQTSEVLSVIDGLLAKAGTDKTKLISATIYLTDIATFADMNAVWENWIVEGHTPARATLEAKLAAPKYNVEIVVIAAI
jgi:enamine deaminase RidA (YjgF/YER057c/UK114 family)